jgi:oligosaccharide repeat unit polymerase
VNRPAIESASVDPDEEIDGEDEAETAPEAPVNPWVPMSKGARALLLGALGIYTATCVVGALVSGAPNGGLLAASTLFYLGVLAIPLIAYDDAEHGWFHPLMFGTLFTMAKGLPTRASILIFGLEEHAVIAADAETLTGLVAYDNFLNALALLALYAGFRFVRRPPVPRLRWREPRRLWVVVIAVFVIAGLAMVALIGLSGSFSQHFLNLSLNAASKQFEREVTGIGHLATAAQLPAWILAIVLAYRPELLRKPWFLLLGFSALALVYLATGKRSLLLSPVAVGAVAWMMATRRVPLFRLLLLGGGAFGLFSVLLLVRGVASTGAKDLNDVGVLMAERAEGTFSASLDELSYRAGGYASIYPILHHVPEEVPLLWGESYLTLLARPIPRVIWPTKPRGTDFRTGVTFYNSPWGVPPGAVGEAFWNFHVPGVVGIFFLFGIFKRWLYRLVIEYGEHGFVLFFYAFTALIFAPSENTVTQWLLTLLPALLFAVLTGVVRGRRGS